MDITLPVPDLSDDELYVPSKPAGPLVDPSKAKEDVWSELKSFYNDNATFIERSRNLDLGKGERDADFQISMDTFVETTKLILDGLTALANVHPVLGGELLGLVASPGILLISP